MEHNFDDIIGKPFKSGERGPDSYDCYGCAIAVYERYGIKLPACPITEYTATCIANKIEEETQKKQWKRIEEPIVPCIVVMKISCESWANHVGVYIGDGKFIQAYKKSGVVIDKIKKWKNYIEGYYIPGGEDIASNS